MSPVEQLYTMIIGLLPDEVLKEHGQTILMESLRLRTEEKNRLKAAWLESRVSMGGWDDFEEFYAKFKKI